MKIKQMAKWFGESSWVTPAVVFVVLILGNLLAAGMAGKEKPSIFGTEISFFIGAFVVGIVTFSTGLRFGVTIGVSRRSIFLGLLLSELVYSIINGLAVLLLALIGYFFLSTNTMTAYQLLYQGGVPMGGKSLPVPSLMTVPWCALGVLCAMLAGGFVGGVFYRLGRRGKILWAVGLPTAIFVLLPIGISLLPQGSQERMVAAIAAFLQFLGSSPFYIMGFFLGASVLLGGLVWLLMRRAALKTA